ncbi:MAG: hypothetical protein GY792_12835, partial [Gammaproteobacteria bacterium]|nr:hypothetical protein [Gammaproteobacteria bacterium]
ESYLTHAALQARIEDYAAARDILKQSRELDSEIPAERRHARNLLAWFSHLMGGTPDKQYAGAGAKLLDVALSPDGKLLATVGEKGTVVLFETESGELLKRLEGHTHKARGVLFHPEGRWLATAGDDRRIILWSLPDGDILRQWEAPANIWALALSPDSALLASAGTDKNITLWKPETGAHVQTLKGHENNIDGLAFSPDGNLLASAAYDYTVRIWEVKTGKSLHTLQGYTGEVTGVTFHPDGKILAIASADKDVRLWELEPGKPLAVLQGHKNAVIGVTFVDAGKHLISASMDRTLRIWDTESGVALRVLQGHEAGVTDVTARGKTLFSAGNDGKARRWASGEKQAASFAVLDLPGEPASCAIVPDGSAVAVGLADGALRLYALHERKLLWENTEAHTNDINRIAFSPDGKQLASASFDNTVKLWQVSDGALEQTFSGHTDSVYGVAFSPEGGLIASASYDGRIGLFEIGKQEGDFFPAHEGQVYSVAFGASGLRLVSAGDDSRTRLWDLSARPPALLWEFFVSSEAVSWAAFSPDGSRIASVGRDYLVHILNSDDGSKVGRLVGHENTIRRVAFSPDGGQVATVSTDATVRLWDVTTATELFALRLPTNRGWPTPLWDFDFRCTGADCRIAVPLTRGKLVLYYLEGIYE